MDARLRGDDDLTAGTMGDFLDRPSAVREGEDINRVRLLTWLRAHLPEVGLDARGELAVEQFGRGYSNLTYLVRAGAREVVLRRSPPGVRIKSAHDMGREFRILSRLSAVWPKAPRALAQCDDPSMIGTPFYVMERTPGVILRARVPSGIDLGEARMRHLSRALVDTLAEIHAIDYRAAGLGDLGRPEGYAARQLEGWTERYRKAQTDDVPQHEELGRWLFAHVPLDVGAVGATLIHNDFKYDNVVLDPASFDVRAVLDWEMATVGDPLMDLGTTLGYWIDADDPPVFQVMVFGPTNRPGSLRRIEVVERYAERTGRDVSNILWYYACALHKLAVVAQQLYKRWKDGLTKEDRYAPMLEGVRAVSTAALHAIAKGRIDRLAEP